MYASVAISLPRDASVTPWGQAVTGQEGQVNAGTVVVVVACLVGLPITHALLACLHALVISWYIVGWRSKPTNRLSI